LKRINFNVTVNAPKIVDSEDKIKERWAAMLRIPKENFTNICVDPRINNEYAQIYMNGIVLSLLMNNVQDKLKETILSNREFAASYMRGIFAGEGQVALKKWGTISFIAITCGTEEVVEWYKTCLNVLEIKSSKYQPTTMKFPIYSRKNLEKVLLWKICDLQPEKKEIFEFGISTYQRNVMKRDEMEKLILKQLSSGPKTYDEISKNLNKGRSTIQSFYIPMLEKKNVIKRIGKKKQAWLFEITNSGKKILEE